MIIELGHFALILALLLAATSGVLGLLGAAREQAPLMLAARTATLLQTLLVSLAFAALAAAFLGDDFSVRYVAQHSNSQLPAIYKFAATWGGHEGSLLLWILMLVLWSGAVAIAGRKLPLVVQARVLGTLGLVGCGFLLFILFTSNPFSRLLPAAADGADLNPLLQDPGLILHPPLLYMGYVGFSVAFAFAIAALLAGRLDAAWARWSRPWTTAAWCALTLGIALGSAWAYYELGWGGWWFWDPVENASLMPWLAGTALLHSLAVAEKRGAFKHWTVLLAIAAFSLSLLGTFLVRSGVLSSVHAFATDPARGTFILLFLCVVIGGSLALYAWRAPQMEGGPALKWFSREGLLLANNVFLIAACGTVLLGTLYPLLIDALGLGKLSVGPPYFNSVFAPIMLPLLALLALIPVVRWKQEALRPALLAQALPLGLALPAGLLLPLLWGAWRWGVALALGIAVWIVLAALRDLILRLRQGKPSAAFVGMHTAHVGMAILLAGITVVSAYQHETQVRMAPGESKIIGNRTLQFEQMEGLRGPNYMALRGTFLLIENGRTIATLRPEKRQYLSSKMPMSESAIYTRFSGDTYLALGEMLGSNPMDSDWIVQIHSKPLVSWLWVGAIVMALGGLIAASDRRYRRKQA